MAAGSGPRARGREVLIPVVGATGGALVRVIARHEAPPAHPAGLDPVISELIEHGLYQAGQVAWAALRRCGQRRGGWLASSGAYISVANPGDFGGLSPANARSAELGLALALALQRAGSPLREVLATGMLDPGSHDPSVPVRPIAHLQGKLDVIAAEFRQAGAAPAPSLLLLPRTDPDGTPVETRYAERLDELAKMGIRTRVVDTLAEALVLVAARRMARHPAETAVKTVAALVLLIGLAVAGAWQFLTLPIDASFTPVARLDGTTLITPLRARMGAQGNPEVLPACAAGPATRLATGEMLAIRFVTAPQAPTRWLGIQAAVVAVGSISGVKVLPLPLGVLAGFVPGETQGFVAEVIDPAQENLLAILLQPGRAFDLTSLESHLRARIDPLDPAVRLSAASNLLRTMAPGVLFHRFTSTGDVPPCP